MSVSPEHETLHRIFQHDPALFARAVARTLDIEVTEPRRMSELNVDLTETRPIERRADSVLRAELMVENPEGDYILIIESQTDPEDTRRRSWPYYITFVQNKYDCDVVLLVVCSKAATAKWAREPIRVGRPGLTCLTVTPVVLGPDNIAANLAEFTEAGLDDTPGQQIWRALMATETFPFVSEMRAKGRAEGRAEGEAKAVLRILKRRKVAVDDASRQRIESCTNVKTLETWLDRSLTATTVGELFQD